MTMHDIRLSRRSLLTGTAALVIGVHLAPRGLYAQNPASVPLNAFVRVEPDSIVTVLVKHIEMGQGPLTGLTTLVAEEMDADWSQMRAEQAPSNPELYKNLLFGIQGTGGSTAIANSFEQMRKAGAAARAMLVEAAAQAWSVPASEITVESGVIRHSGSGKEGRFGDFVEAASKLTAPADPKLKDPSEFKLIGREDSGVKRLDSKEKSTGKAKFTIDASSPGVLTVVVAHPPLFGAKAASFDDTKTRKVKGVVDVKQIGTGVAVYAEGMWPALKGREALKVTWDETAAEKRSSQELIELYRGLAQKPGAIAGAHGDADAAIAGADKVVEAEFVFPYLAHAPMEPLDGYLEWDGQSAVARFGSQLQTGDHHAIANILGIPMEKVRIDTLLAGGSFGRRAQQTMHLAAELAEAAKAIGPSRPVKLVWTREDDIRGGYYRPIFVHRMRGGIKDGKISGWSNTVVGQSILKGSAFESMMVKDGIDATSVEGARELLYDVADFRCDLHTTSVGVPVLWWRSVGHTHTGYAVECFLDQLLEEAGLDPVEGRLAMMGKSPRAAGALKAVAELAKWNGPGPVEGRARGVAVVESFNTFVAQIAEVSAGEKDGPRVHKVWCAVDCGIAVNPDIIRAQMEGGIGYGLGHVLFAEIAMDKGHVVQGNFDSYRSLRINEMPEVEVVIVKSAEKPTGVGEPGVPPIGPAVANAMARLGLGRPQRLPFTGGTV